MLGVAVVVVLQHFYQCCYRSAVILLLERDIVSCSLVINKHDGHEDLCDLSRQNVILYIHRRIKLYCLKHVLPV
jgi:hypothetical protein